MDEANFSPLEVAQLDKIDAAEDGRGVESLCAILAEPASPAVVTRLCDALDELLIEDKSARASAVALGVVGHLLRALRQHGSFDACAGGFLLFETVLHDPAATAQAVDGGAQELVLASLRTQEDFEDVDYVSSVASLLSTLTEHVEHAARAVRLGMVKVCSPFCFFFPSFFPGLVHLSSSRISLHFSPEMVAILRRVTGCPATTFGHALDTLDYLIIPSALPAFAETRAIEHVRALLAKQLTDSNVVCSCMKTLRLMVMRGLDDASPQMETWPCLRLTRTPRTQAFRIMLDT